MQLSFPFVESLILDGDRTCLEDWLRSGVLMMDVERPFLFSRGVESFVYLWVRGWAKPLRLGEDGHD